MLARVCTTLKCGKARVSVPNRRVVSLKRRPSPIAQRTLATAATAQMPVVHMHLDNGNHKLLLPLPSGERVLSLREHLNVSSFIQDLLAEDSEVKSVVVSDEFGRVAKATPVKSLLNSDWVLSINDLAKSDAQLVSLRARLEAKIDEENQIRMSLSDYIQLAEDLGVPKEKAMQYLRTLHKLGVVLFFEHNLELKDTLILNPRLVTAAVEEALNVPHVRASTKKSLEAQLEALKARALAMTPEYETIDTKASRSANVVFYSVLGGLLFQWLLFARFTWWDFSWDVMEPVTYFTMTAELSIGGYLWYLWSGSEYANESAWSILYNWRFRNIARRRNFNIEEWNQVNNGIIKTQKEIEHYHE